MKRLLWIAPILFVLLAGSALADSVTTLIFFQPNDGSGDNFGAFQKGNGFQAAVGGGVPFDFFNIGGYAPGSTLGGTTDFFIEGGSVQIGGTFHELTPLSIGSVFMSSFTLPTNGKFVVTVPVEVDFAALMAAVDTGQTFDLSGGNRGTITFQLQNGFYFPSGFVNASIPEPGTLGLMCTGLISILALVRKRITV